MIDYFPRKDYRCSAPEWPDREPDKTAAQLRDSTPPEPATIGVKELTDHYESSVRAYPEPPILIGHSFGGLIVQQLLDRGFGSAGICFDSAAPEGVLAVDWTVLKENPGSLFGWMNWETVVHMSLAEFAFAFTNTFPEEEQQKYYERYCIPETGRIFFQAAFAQLAPHHALRVNFRNNDRAPLLLTADELDHMVPAQVARSNYKHYQHATARTDFKEFAGRAHLLLAQEGWEELAGYAADWLDQVGHEGAEQPTALSAK
jgi:pimeloyl-ACP methyl ester carboxylesterase